MDEEGGISIPSFDPGSPVVWALGSPWVGENFKWGTDYSGKNDTKIHLPCLLGTLHLSGKLHPCRKILSTIYFCRKKSAGIQHFYPPGHGTRFFKPQLSAHCFGGTTAKKTSTDDMARSGLLTTVVPLGRSRGADCTGEQEV